MYNRFSDSNPNLVTLTLVAATAALGVLAHRPAVHAQAIEAEFIECEVVGDSQGFAVAAGGDFNGDGATDFAFSAPCHQVGDDERSGRVFVRSGSNGRTLARVFGTQRNGFLGTTLAFVGDVNGDGRDDLAIGSPAFNALDPSNPGEPINNAGRVDVYAHRNSDPILSIFGSTLTGEFGASVAGIGDINGDGFGDLAIGETGARSPIRNRRAGAVHIVSGADGRILQTRAGLKTGQKLGLSVANVGLIDGDASSEVLVTGAKTPSGGVRNSGHLAVLPALDVLASPLIERSGARDDRLGEASDADGMDGTFVIGAPGSKVAGIKNAGVAEAFDAQGNRLFQVADVVPQKAAGFGTSVAMVGDANGDDVSDYAASAPFADVLPSQEEGFLTDAGRFSLLDGTDGSVLWSLEGSLVGEKLGRSLAGRIDFNNDGVADLVSGSPGAAPEGRRGAGAVTIHSGVDGRVLESFAGRRGLETRLFVFGRVTGARARSFNAAGELQEVNARVLGREAGEELSLAVLGETRDALGPGRMRLVVGTGHRGGRPRVTVMSASRRRAVFNRFNVGPAFDGYTGGVTVAAGDLNNSGDERIAVAMADSATGDVDVAIFRELVASDTDFDGWLLDNRFPAFTNADEIDTGNDEVPTPVRINADGANIVMANLAANSGRELLVAPIDGVPVVRMLSRSGEPIREWLAYNNQTVSGVNLAIADLEGDGARRILTAPVRGRALIRAFNPSGAPYVPPGSGEPLAFLAAPETFNAGARVAAADVDLDGSQEIIVVLGGSGSDRVLAFEVDGTPVEGFTPFSPFGGAAVGGGTAIAGTDRYVRP